MSSGTSNGRLTLLSELAMMVQLYVFTVTNVTFSFMLDEFSRQTKASQEAKATKRSESFNILKKSEAKFELESVFDIFVSF